MADHDPEYESLTKQVNEHDPSSIHFDNDKKAFRIIGRDTSVHQVLGGGKSADVLLWRDKKKSVGVVGIATTVWMLFELFQYHLISLTCNILIVVFTALFLWSNLTSFINRPPPRIPELSVSDDTILRIVSTVRAEINKVIGIFRDIVVGGNLKKFLGTIASLWVISVIGSWADLLTLFYICFLLLHSVPVLYEKHEDRVNPLAEKAVNELQKQYAVFDAKVLSKIPKGPLEQKKVA